MTAALGVKRVAWDHIAGAGNAKGGTFRGVPPPATEKEDKSMKHEADLKATEVVPTQIITDVVFTASPTLNMMIDSNAKAREEFARLQAVEAEKRRQQELAARRQQEEAALRAQNSYCDCSLSRSGIMRY